MSILKRALGTFIEFDEPPKRSAVIISNNKIIERNDPPPVMGIPTETSPEMLAEMHKNLDLVLKEANDTHFLGTDFYEFFESKKELDTIPQEPLRYTIAFNIEKKKDNNLTKEKLVSTGREYIKILDKESEEFEDGIAHINITKIENARQEVKNIRDEIAKMDEQIQELHTKAANLDSETTTLESTIVSRKQVFHHAISQYKQQIETEIEKINTYIK